MNGAYFKLKWNLLTGICGLSISRFLRISIVFNPFTTQVAGVDSHITRVEKKVENGVSLGYQFIGKGIYGESDGSIDVKYGTTVSECLQILQVKRQSDPTWNGIAWLTTDGCCEIQKNDRGHRSAGWPKWLHYRAYWVTESIIYCMFMISTILN